MERILVRYKIPKTIIWVANLMAIFLIIFTLSRFATYFAFREKGYSFASLIPSFLMGIRYDLRWIAIIMLPIILISIIPKLSPFYSARNKKGWTWYLAIVTFIVFFFFAAGFVSYSYNRTPLDAGAMNFIEDPGISLRMMFQTYPMVWMILGLLAAVLIFRWMYHRSHWRVISKTEGLGIPYKRKYFVIVTVLFALIIYGKFSWPPLSRSDSFRFKDSFKAYMAINPLQNFFSTLKLRKPTADEQKAKAAFPLMADWMQLQDKKNFNYRREIAPRSNSLESRPNIILVQCESFSMFKSSMSGNPLDASPFFDSLSKKGIFFDRCFAPHFSTARALFAIITGIPDAQMFKFSTRNPKALIQRTIINGFEGYSKHYFLGGDPDFNNFEGLLKNIDSLQMHTKASFKLPMFNVWGISDKDLFHQANTIFKKEQRPFFAYIHTSGNHRPYMVPEKDTADFKMKYVSDEDLQRNGFGSLDEFNAFRYFDYCFRQFMNEAQKESYFQNTIFVFVGDHGVAGNAEATYPPAWTDERLTDEHVPLLFYAPYLLQPQKREEIVSQIDVLPTIAGMLHQSYINTTLGRDLLDPEKKNNYAFITNTAGKIGMVTDDYYYITDLNFPDAQLVPVKFGALPYTKPQRDSIQKRLADFTAAFYETAKYMLLNNH